MNPKNMKKTTAIKNYLYSTLVDTYVIAAGHRDFIYKGLIKTPLGWVKFDTGFDCEFVTARHAQILQSAWKYKELPSQKIETIELVKNWDQFKPYFDRPFAIEMVKVHRRPG